ncbi:MAG: iron transporter permease [Cypionkella sp.]|uniref:ABC transporter permease n=1 Tax=Cypionkella sp. TaxID=2811411 RepID=UPI002609513E|nr:iron ABC transporter permease [Cypionkella sp.]MDB5657733.1 iron transporter permease [Cypionkella sp.]
MTTPQNSETSRLPLRKARVRRPRPDIWVLGSALIGLVVLAPLAAVVWIAFHPTENIWPHLLSTVLPRYFMATLRMMLGVGVLSAAMGAGAAWLVVMYRFPGSRALDYALLFPMAIPAYVGAYALVDFLDYAGPLQLVLRGTFGWTSARDYWFPEIHSEPAAILVLSAALYPYVYLLTRSALREQSGASYEVARSLGLGPWGLFWRLGLPLVRPAIAVGVALTMMETVADFGTVSTFGVQTLTTGVFSTWLNGGNAGGAAQIAGVILLLVLVLLSLEYFSRRNARFHRQSRASRPVTPIELRGLWGWLAAALCAVPFGLGFVLPTAVMLGHALTKPHLWLAPALATAALNTVIVGGIAAILTVSAALFLVYGVRMAGRTFARTVLGVTVLGYAMPGAVLAVGLLIPLAALDHRVADAVLAVTGHDPGLLLTGTSAAIVLAYLVRFFGIAQGAVDSAFGRISPSLPMAARSLGRGVGGTLRDVYLPLMRGSVLAALLLVFVECVKELPATLLLRPFNFNTLATRVYELASLERIGEAAPAALIVTAMGLVAVALLVRATR